MSEGIQQYPNVTRVVVVDNNGRVFEERYQEDGVEIHFQDGGRTIKVFAGQPSNHTKESN